MASRHGRRSRPRARDRRHKRPSHAASIKREQPHAPYTTEMPLDIAAVQAALERDGLDGWLLYDFHGSNPIARRLAGLRRHGKMTTRRWYYLIPADRGAARSWCTPSSVTTSTHLPGDKTRLRRPRAAGQPASNALLDGRRSASRWSTRPATPSRTSRASTPARSRRCAQLGVEVVSSGDLVQRFEAIWSDEALATHRAASERALPDQGPRVRMRPRAACAAGTRDHRVRRAAARWSGWFAEEGLVSRRAAGRRRAGERRQSALPADRGSASRRSAPTKIVLLDLWGKLPDARRGVC